jgi:hypothetical protein
LDREGFVPARLLSSPAKEQESCQAPQSFDLYGKIASEAGHNPVAVKPIVATRSRAFTYPERDLT